MASGFAEIVNTKGNKKRKADSPPGAEEGDDWYDIKYRQLEGQPPPPSIFGPSVDALQIKVKHYLDGAVDEETGETLRTQFSSMGRFLFFSLIILNVTAVVLESVPEIDRSVGNAPGNFFDVFEAWSVIFFTIGKSKRCQHQSARSRFDAHNINCQITFSACFRRGKAARHSTLLGCIQERSLASLTLCQSCRGTCNSC